MSESLETVADYLAWGERRLDQAGLHYGHGTDNPRDEAVWLVCHALGWPPMLDHGHLAHRVTEAEAQAIGHLIEQRIGCRQPAAYLTRTAWFAGLCFEAGPQALVPRSPIAELIVSGWVAERLPPQPRILDLCTGGGSIGIAAAVYCDDARVVASDLSADALALARRNVAQHQVADRVTLVESDLFDRIQGTFDLILTNPPYVGRVEMDQLPAEYRHEPAAGLASGADGLDIPLRILASAVDYLNENGRLVLEVGNSARALEHLFPSISFLWLSFEHGGHGVLEMEYSDLVCWTPEFRRESAKRLKDVQ
ncbi:MAG: 50S ribosomal protein L3 N(5)-glutamine methyltransferase [Xanthomonadales bacterium]|nr:50S ribosomal protein L3 N(5)-glutamine methyltransferase [Xanthomonadales bacterium]